MKNIRLNGHNSNQNEYLVYASYNYYGTINIENCIFTNIVFGISSTSAIYLRFASTSSDVVFISNVVFRDLTTTESDNGLIYIYDSFTVVIENCTFENNVGWVGLVHCKSSSYCDVTIKNSWFIENIFDETGVVMQILIFITQYIYLQHMDHLL